MHTEQFVIFLLPWVLAENYFCHLGCENRHTVCSRPVKSNCSRGDKCGKIFKPLSLDDEARLSVLTAHNELRNMCALGNDTRGGNGQASNMNALSYDKELEYVAQCWSNNCEKAHDKCRSTRKFSGVGQNIFWSASDGDPDFTTNELLEKAVASWYNEITMSTSNTIDSFGENWEKIGHFTQVVWAETTHVGCGRTIYQRDDWNKVIIVCNYGSAGNVANAPVYLRGEPTSKCADGRNKKYKALCGDIEDFTKDNWAPPLTQND